MGVLNICHRPVYLKYHLFLQAFSAFGKAREEDLSKREKLLEIYHKVEETIVGKCTEELLEILKEHFGYNVQVEFAKKKKELLVKEYIVLFAGKHYTLYKFKAEFQVIKTKYLWWRWLTHLWHF